MKVTDNAYTDLKLRQMYIFAEFWNQVNWVWLPALMTYISMILTSLLNV